MIVVGALRRRGPTRYFLRHDKGGEHVVVIDLDVVVEGDATVAVVVPVPLAHGSHVSFLELGRVPQLFDELEEHFALPRRRHDDAAFDDDDEPPPRPRSGAFNARLCVSRDDLDADVGACVDDRFDDDRFDGDAFAVFRFSGVPPPFGLRFLPRDAALCFPTRRNDNGVVAAAADFDDVLYLQGLPLQTGWHKSRKKTQARTHPALVEFVDDNEWVRRRRIRGPHENVDVRVALAQPTNEPRPVPALSFIEQLGERVFGVSDGDLWGLDDDDDTPETLFTGLERRLLEPRSRLAAAEEFLAADFVEIGASGARYDRASTLAALATAPPPTSTALYELTTTALSDDVVLVLYRTKDSRRSSLWQRTPDGWRLRFHHGTRG